MKIEKMYESYLKRHGVTKNPLTKKVDAVFKAFRRAVDKIPEEHINQAIDMDLSSGDHTQCWMCFEKKHGEFQYALGFALAGKIITGRVDMSDVIAAIKVLEDFAQKKYHRPIEVDSFDWEITSLAMELNILISYTEQEKADMEQGKLGENPSEELERRAKPMVDDLADTYDTFVDGDAADDVLRLGINSCL